MLVLAETSRAVKNFRPKARPVEVALTARDPLRALPFGGADIRSAILSSDAVLSRPRPCRFSEGQTRYLYSST